MIRNMDREEQLEFDPEAAVARLESSIPEVKGKILKRGLNDVHEAFADYLLLNPGCTLREMKQVFGYSISWISSVTTSDMFRAYLAQRRAGVEVVIANDLPARLKAAAALATERIIETLETTSDPDVIVDAFDKVMHRYGYAPNAKTGAQAPQQMNVQNNFFLSKDDLAQARGALIEAHAGQPVLEGSVSVPSAGDPVPST